MTEFDANQTTHVDAAAFLRYADKLKLNLTCPICGSQEFTLITTERGRALVLIDWKMGSLDLSDTRVSEMLSVSCNRCAHDRLFKRDNIAEWVRKNP